MPQNATRHQNTLELHLLNAHESYLFAKALQHWFHTKDDVRITSLALHDQEWQQVQYIVQLINLLHCMATLLAFEKVQQSSTCFQPTMSSLAIMTMNLLG